MSVAFTREDSAQTAQEISLPERPISPHPNLVTETGLQALEAALAEAKIGMEAAREVNDMGARRQASEAAVRDMRYFAERLRSAELVAAPLSSDIVAFGGRVTFARDDGRRQTFRIVGEDESDPREGKVSYVSPIARALMGKRVGDVATVGRDEVEILTIG
jgi:transcription elongation GreA/GreB family factor